MRQLSPLLLSFSLLTAVTAGAQAETRPMKNLDVFELEVAADPQISPDGTSVVYARRSNDIMTDRARSNLWMIGTDGKSHRPLLSGKASYSSPRWSPSGDRLAYISNEQGAGPQLFVRWW